MQNSVADIYPIFPLAACGWRASIRFAPRLRPYMIRVSICACVADVPSAYFDTRFGVLAKVWTSDGLWKGFLRCARMMAKESGATSFIAMVQLPDKTLKEALAHPLMKVNDPFNPCSARAQMSDGRFFFRCTVRTHKFPVCLSSCLTRWKLSPRTVARSGASSAHRFVGVVPSASFTPLRGDCV